ncbi:hypothetical protein Tco_1318784 [Tanacetum coccineum]
MLIHTYEMMTSAIIIPSYPSHNLQEAEPKDTSSDEGDDSPHDSAEEIFQQELARLKGQVKRATSDVKDAEERQTKQRTKNIPLGSIPVSYWYIKFLLVAYTRFPSLSDLGNNEHHHLGIFSSSSYDDEFGADLNNLASTVEVSPVATKRINTIHPQSLFMRDHTLSWANKKQVKKTPTAQALEDPSWVDAMQEEMQQFKFQNVWVLVDLPEDKYAIGTKWNIKNKRDAKGIVMALRVRFFIEMMRKYMTATTPYEAPKPKSKNEPDSPVNVHLYRSMIGSLMYLTASRPDIMFAVSACSRNQVTPTTSNLEAVKKIFKYLKGQPKLGLWYPRESPFVFEAYSDSDYAGANKDRKSTTSGWATYATFYCMLSQAGEGAGVVVPAVPQVIPDPIPEPMPETDQPQDHVTAPPRQQPSTSTNVEDEPLRGSFHTSPPRKYILWKLSSRHTSSYLRLWWDPKLVKKVKALEVKLKTKKRKVVLSDSDQEDGGEPDVDLDALIALANVAVTVDSTKSPGGASSNLAACSYDPTSDDPTSDDPTSVVPTTVVPTDVPSGVDPTGPSTVSPGSTIVPTSNSIPADESIPARSGTTTATPSNDRKGKGVAVEEPTPTQDKTFRQLEEERLGWEAAQRLQAQELADLEKHRDESLMQDANLARQMAQDFEMTEDQRKRQQEVLASGANYSDADWDIILARLQANPDLSSTIFWVDFTDNDFAAKMVDLVTSRRKELAEQWAKEWRDRPMTPAQLRQCMRTYLQEEFDKIQRAVAFTRGLKRDGSPMSTTSSKKHKTSDVDVDVEAPSHGVSQETILEVQAEVPSQEATVEDVEVPSNIVSKAHQTASSLKKVGTKKKRLGRKGVHTSPSTILIEEGDPDAEHKLCIKYASDEDSASNCDTPVHLYAVVDWELLPTGLGPINAIYRLENSRKYFTSLREILHLVTRADLMMIYGRVMTFYQDKKAEGVGLVLSGDLQILMDSPEVNDGSDFWKNQHTWSIQNWKLYSFSGVHVLETLIAFLKKQISDSKRPKVHDWVINSPCYHNKELASPEQMATAEVVPKSVAGSSFLATSSMLLPFDVQICADVSCVQVKTQADWMLPSKFIVQSSRYVVPTGRVVVPTGRYVVPAGKVIIIVSPGRLSLVPTGRVLSPGSKDLSRVGSNKWYQSFLRVSHKKNIPKTFQGGGGKCEVIAVVRRYSRWANMMFISSLRIKKDFGCENNTCCLTHGSHDGCSKEDDP